MALKFSERDLNREKLHQFKRKNSKTTKQRLEEFRHQLESSFKNPRPLTTWKNNFSNTTKLKTHSRSTSYQLKSKKLQDLVSLENLKKACELCETQLEFNSLPKEYLETLSKFVRLASIRLNNMC